MAQLSLSRAWEETVTILARDGGLLATVALALIVLPQVILAVVGVPVGSQATLLAQAIYVAVILLGFVAQIGLNRLAIGPSVTVGAAIRQGFVRLIPLVVVFVVLIIGLVLIAVVVAMVLGAANMMALPAAGQPPPASLVGLLILLTALTFAIFQLVFPVAAVETGNPIRLFARSWQLGHRQYLRLLAFVVVVFIGLGVVLFATQFGIGSALVLLLGRASPGSVSALALGLVVGVVQAAFTLVTAVMLARIYVQLAGREAQPGVPSSGM